MAVVSITQDVDEGTAEAPDTDGIVSFTLPDRDLKSMEMGGDEITDDTILLVCESVGLGDLCVNCLIYF